MDQKNTIVKCNATTCLYNYKGICDQYVIDLDMYGQCKDYCECEKTEAPTELKSDLVYNETILPERGLRAKGNFIEDGVSQDIVDEICKPFKYRAKTNRLQGHLGMCMWCDYHRSNCGCAHRKPDIDEETRECYSIKSTGANQ